jgi:hypothetical protein
MGCYSDLISKWPSSIGAIDGIAEPALERSPDLGRQCGVNPMRGDEKTVEGVVLLAFRKPSRSLAISSCPRQGEFEREGFAIMRREQGVSAFLPLVSGDALVEGRANQTANPIDCGLYMLGKGFRAYAHWSSSTNQSDRRC